MLPTIYHVDTDDVLTTFVVDASVTPFHLGVGMVVLEDIDKESTINKSFEYQNVSEGMHPCSTELETVGILECLREINKFRNTKTQVICDNKGAITMCTAILNRKVLCKSLFMANIESNLTNSANDRDNFYISSHKAMIKPNYIVSAHTNNGSLSAQQLRFNYRLQKYRRIIERTNGFLKLRMQAIRETMTAVTTEKAKLIICACMGLYNKSILSGDLKAYADGFEREVVDNGMLVNALT